MGKHHCEPSPGDDQSTISDDEAQTAQDFQALVADSPAAIVVHDGVRIAYANNAALRLCGALPSAEVAGAALTALISPTSIHAMVVAAREAQRRNEIPAPLSTSMVSRDGTTRRIHAHTAKIAWNGRSAYQTVLCESVFEISMLTGIWHGAFDTHNGHTVAFDDRTAAERPGPQVSDIVAELPQLPRSNDADEHASAGHSPHLYAAFAAIDHGIVVLDRDGSIAVINPAALRMMGPTVSIDDAKSARSQDFSVFDTDGHTVPLEQRPAQITLRTGRPVHRRILGFRRSDGQQNWISVSTSLLDPDDPDRSPILLSLADMTTEHLTSTTLRRDARHDALTGLPNRASTLALMTAMLTPSEAPCLAAVIFVDIDQLKPVNDAHGHIAGDQILRTCSERLHGAIRPADTLTRVSGDEFVVLIAAPANRDDLRRIAQRLHDTLKAPIALETQDLTVSASIGITAIESPCRATPTELMHRADAAMYAAKASGPGQTRFG